MSRKENDNPLKGVRWIWWDLDDTLYAPAGAYRTARWDVFVGCYAKAVGRKDDPATRDQLQQLLDGNQGNLKKTFCDLGLPDTTVMDLIAPLDRSALLAPDPKMLAMLDRMSATDIHHGILTNNNRSNTNEILSACGIQFSFFDHILTLEDYSGHEKPDLHPFELAGRTCREDFSRIVVVGDRPAIDLAPAKELGATTILVWTDQPHPVADYVCATPYEIPDLFQKNL
jgi:FMN phosphatase YigB (HAD superfamily)